MPYYFASEIERVAVPLVWAYKPFCPRHYTDYKIWGLFLLLLCHDARTLRYVNSGIVASRDTSTPGLVTRAHGTPDGERLSSLMGIKKAKPLPLKYLGAQAVLKAKPTLYCAKHKSLPRCEIPLR